MNFSSLFGLIMALTVTVVSAVTATKDWTVFLDMHAFIIVIGGTVAASLISFSGSKLLGLLKVFFRRVLGKNAETFLAVNEIVDVARGYRENDKYLKEVIPKIKTLFLKDALQLMSDGGISPEELDRILKKRATTLLHRHEEDAEIFKSLSKFPPAFGLLGAVTGMIAMMQNMGGADAFSKVGPSLAVALVATLYGIALANFIFLPLGENLSKLNRVDANIRQMVIDGVKLIREKKHPLVVEESMRSLLLPSERQELSKKKKAA